VVKQVKTKIATAAKYFFIITFKISSEYYKNDKSTIFLLVRLGLVTKTANGSFS
jgi:hypothetical protein